MLLELLLLLLSKKLIPTSSLIHLVLDPSMKLFVQSASLPWCCGFIVSQKRSDIQPQLTAWNKRKQNMEIGSNSDLSADSYILNTNDADIVSFDTA